METRAEYDDYGTPWLHHFVNKSEASVVAELKKAYRTQKPVGPDVYVRGFIFQVLQKTWSFTLAREGTNIHYVVHVIPKPERNGSSLALMGKERRVVSAAWKRAWYGFSPVGMKAYSGPIRAY